MVEGTLAGLAAGLVATGAVEEETVVHRRPWLDLHLDGKLHEHALVDIVTSRSKCPEGAHYHQTWIGTRALWDPASLCEIVLSSVTAAALGTCSLGGLLFPEAQGSGHGVHIVLGPSERTVLTPLAPGMVCSLSVTSARLMETGDCVLLSSVPCTVALDGEREFEVTRPGHTLEVTLNPFGPRVVDIDAALREGARSGVFVQRAQLHHAFK
jgi:hypothetical protein